VFTVLSMACDSATAGHLLPIPWLMPSLSSPVTAVTLSRALLQDMLAGNSPLLPAAVPEIKRRESNPEKPLSFSRAKRTKLWWPAQKTWGRVCFSSTEGHPEMNHTWQHQPEVYCFLPKSHPCEQFPAARDIEVFL